MFYRNLDYKEEFRAKKKARKYTFNLNKFKEDSADKYYWLGFLGADGAIVNNSLTIELKATDKEHLEKFNLFAENTNPIKERINNDRIAFSEDKLSFADFTINTDDKTLMEITDLVKELYDKKISQ